MARHRAIAGAGRNTKGDVNWVEIDVDKDAEDFDHLITPEERLQVALAIQ